MRKDLIASASISIKAPLSIVWKAITDPGMIEKYFFGTEVITDWKVGSDIVFQGCYEGNKYKDHGKIMVNDHENTLQYTYLSSMSKLEDKPENYSFVTLSMAAKEGGVELSASQKGFVNEEAQTHGNSGWKMILEGIKKLVENT